MSIIDIDKILPVKKNELFTNKFDRTMKKIYDYLSKFNVDILAITFNSYGYHSFFDHRDNMFESDIKFINNMHHSSFYITTVYHYAGLYLPCEKYYDRNFKLYRDGIGYLNESIVSDVDQVMDYLRMKNQINGVTDEQFI